MIHPPERRSIRPIAEQRRAADNPPRGLAWPSAVALLVLAIVARGATAAPHLVANLNTGPTGDDLYESLLGVEHGGVLYFTGNDPQEGRELWRTDGTVGGTYRLTDICPGSCDSGALPVAFLDDALLFIASDGDRQGELWRTDGIPGHETLVQDFCSGHCDASVTDAFLWNRELWLLVRRAGHAPTLWRSDGTPHGTRQVADLCTDLGFCGWGQYTSVWFVGTTEADDALLLNVETARDSLVRTDGTREGTVRLHRFTQLPTIASARAQDATLAGTAVAATQGESAPLFFLDGSQLWVSDGTAAGTRFVRDIGNQVLDTYLQSWQVVAGIFYAITESGEWLHSDGTAAGTFVLAHVTPNFRPVLCRLGSVVYAVTTAGIWRTGGTPATTELIAPWSVEDVEQVVEQRNRLFIQAFPDLWISDGTPTGLRRIRLAGIAMPDEYSLVPLRDEAAFTAGGNELLTIDPSGETVTPLRNLEPADGSSGPYGQIVFDGQLFFCALTAPDYGSARLFASDGTTAGTRIVSAEAQGAACMGRDGSALLASVGAHLFFDANGRPWATDGTPGGSRVLGNPATLASGTPIAAIGDRLIFSGGPPSYGECPRFNIQPWITDGTPSNTQEIVALNPFFGPLGGSQCDSLPLSSDPGPGVSLGQTVLFAADDLLHGRELFSTDGTAAGTHLVLDINPGTMPNTVTEDGKPPLIGVGSNPSSFVRLGSGAFFVADDGQNGRQLWFSTGERRGTFRVVDRDHLVFDSAPHDLVVFQGALYFIAAHGAGEALFRSDATSAGTVMVSDLVLAGQPSFARELTAAGGHLFFVAFNETTGSELWVTRGTTASTHLVDDLRPGPLGSAPQHLTAAGRVVVFAADDGASGLEPWRSDGTAAGTHRLADIAAGSASSSPGPFSVVGRWLLFGADDGIHGRELWALPLADLGTGVAEPSDR